jgi:hypothetical protein
VDRDAKHIAQHRYTDLKPDTGEKADQDGVGKEVGEKSQFEDPRQKQKPGGLARSETQGALAAPLGRAARRARMYEASANKPLRRPLLQQRLRILQIARVKPFREPAVNRSQ